MRPSRPSGETLTDGFARLGPARTTPVLETGRGCLPGSNADVVPTIGGLRSRLLVGRLRPGDPEAFRRRAGALEVLRLLDEHLEGRELLVGDR